MRLRIADCGLRIRKRSGRTRCDLPFPIRNPKSAIRNCVLLLAACTPVTTRPDFKPDPRALVVMLNARPERVAVALDSLLPADSLAVVRFNVRDGYVETSWFDPARHRSYRHQRDIADLPGTVKIATPRPTSSPTAPSGRGRASRPGTVRWEGASSDRARGACRPHRAVPSSCRARTPRPRPRAAAAPGSRVAPAGPGWPRTPA